jgi:hypothetical protein
VKRTLFIIVLNVSKASVTNLSQPSTAVPLFLLNTLNPVTAVYVRGPEGHVVKESSSVWFMVEMVGVKQFSSMPSKPKSAREIKLKWEGGEMIFIKA